MIIIWTKHAKERQREWQRKLGITLQEVEQTLRDPEQIVQGDRDVLVAQSKRAGGLLRIPFIEIEGNRKILTLYWTSRIDKYWRKDQDEDTI